MKRRTILSTSAVAVIASVAGCSVLDGNGNGSESDTGNGNGTGTEVSAQEQYDYEGTITLEGTYITTRDDQENYEQDYNLTREVSGYVDGGNNVAYFKTSWELESGESGEREFFYKDGTNYTKKNFEDEWINSYDFVNEFMDTHVGGVKAVLTADDSTSESFSVDETETFTQSITLQEHAYYEPFLSFLAGGLGTVTGEFELEFDEETGNVTNSTLTVESEEADNENSRFMLNVFEESLSYSELSDYEEPDV